ANNDITVSSAIAVAPSGTAGSLTLDAGRSIVLNASLATGGGNLTLTANDTVADGVVNADRDPGNAVIAMASGVSLQAGAGTFAGLGEGARFSAGGQTLKISYQNDRVTLLVAPVITFTPSPLPAGTTGTPYSQALTGSGGTAPYHNFTVMNGVFPPGLTLAP